MPSTTATHVDASTLNAALGSNAVAFALEWVGTCTSSNTELLNRGVPADDLLHILVADHQSAGRGRRGRDWQSWTGGSLTFSVLWRFPAGSTGPAGLSLAVGLAVARALEELGVTGVQLKWPNDVLINGSKLAGILIELVTELGRPAAAVIGIGVNLHLPDDIRIPDQPAVTDLKRELAGKSAERVAVLAAILGQLRSLLETYAGAGFAALRGAWEQRNAFADLPVRISGDSESVVGICIGVDDDGALLLRTDRGLRRILSGDVSLRPDVGNRA